MAWAMLKLQWSSKYQRTDVFLPFHKLLILSYITCPFHTPWHSRQLSLKLTQLIVVCITHTPMFEYVIVYLIHSSVFYYFKTNYERSWLWLAFRAFPGLTSRKRMVLKYNHQVIGYKQLSKISKCLHAATMEKRPDDFHHAPGSWWL